MKPWVRVVAAVALATPLVGTSTVAADGEPATGFGVNGVVIDNLSADPQSNNLLVDVIGDADGNLVVAGALQLPGDLEAKPFVARYLPNGDRDPNFGTAGVVLLGAGPFDQINAIASLPTGSTLVSSFGHSRVVHPDGASNSTGYAIATTLVELPDGRILAVNHQADTGVRNAFTVMDPSGGLIGSAGDISALLEDQAFTPTGGWVAPSGLVIISGATVRGGSPVCVLIAFDASLNVEPFFGVSGEAVMPQGDSQSCEAAQFPNGNIIVRNSTNSAATMVDEAGAIIGTSTIPIPNTAFLHPPIMAADGSGRLLVAEADGHGVRAFLADGSVDTTFGTLGFADFPGDLRGIRVLDTGKVALWGEGPGFQGVSIILKVLASPVGTAPQPPEVATAKFVPLPPTRILDTREGVGAPRGPLGTGGQIDLQVTGVGGVPAVGAAAVVMNVTATEAAQAGFITAFPSGTRRPTVSNLNLETAGQTAANLVTVKVGANGMVSLFSSGGTQLIADIAGYYTPATTSRDGRLETAAPARILDTRLGLGAPKAKLDAGGHIDLQVTGAGPVPTSGVSAVILNVTADQATADGFVTVWPAGLDRPVVSNLNLVTNETRPNLVIVPIGAGGKVSLFSQSGAELIADVAGWFTDSTSADDSAGLFVPITPTRVLDTRLFPAPLVIPEPPPGAAPGTFFVPPPTIPLPTTPGSTVTRQIGSSTIIPPRSSIAVAANITVTESSGAGFITAWPAGTAQPLVSNLNSSHVGQTIPNAAIVPLGADRLSLFTQRGGHLIVDINGWYTNS